MKNADLPSLPQNLLFTKVRNEAWARHFHQGIFNTSMLYNLEPKIDFFKWLGNEWARNEFSSQ